MDWFQHPSYRHVLDGILERFRARKFAFKPLKHIVFLCGARDSQPRQHLIRYLRKWHHEDVLVFRADEVWEEIASTTSLNALEMEEELASLADVVAIVVESPGTFAEVGAFSMSLPLREKLLLILDRGFQHKPSFINSGPVKWVDQGSRFRPSIFVDLSTVLDAAEQVSERLNRLPKPVSELVDSSRLDRKRLLFLTRDLVSAIGPVTTEHVRHCLGQIAPGVELSRVHEDLSLASALGLVSSARDISSGRVFFFPRRGDQSQSFLYRRTFELSRERARLLGAMLRIPIARPVLELVGVIDAQRESKQGVVA